MLVDRARNAPFHVDAENVGSQRFRDGASAPIKLREKRGGVARINVVNERRSANEMLV